MLVHTPSEAGAQARLGVKGETKVFLKLEPFYVSSQSYFMILKTSPTSALVVGENADKLWGLQIFTWLSIGEREKIITEV